MSRDIKRLYEGRIDKIVMKLRAWKDVVPAEFVRKHYVNTAAYGKFNTIDEANIILKLYKEHTMTQAKATTPVSSLEHALTIARQAEQQAQEASRQATAAAEQARIKLGDSTAAHEAAKVALGKAKLTDAIALIESVYTTAPKGSAANRDITGLLDRLAVKELEGFLFSGRTVFPRGALDTFYGINTGRSSMASPNIGANIPKSATSATAESIANLQTQVGAGQPRQAKPSPAPYHCGHEGCIHRKA